MNNLFERLEPSVRENLLADIERFPFTIKEIIDKLKNSVAITQLTLGEVDTLTSYSDKHIEKLFEVYDMFKKN
jgi:uncharacterized protein YfkK (UPF0435 family)